MSGLIYIVYAPSYDENVGGIIFLHELVHQLRKLGEEAYLWPQQPIFRPSRRGRLKAFFYPEKYVLNPELNTPVATRSLLKDTRAVVVYPEIIPGNPLGIKNVVRWLLYEPGGLLGSIDFGDHDMFFTASGMADKPSLTGGAPELFLWKVNPTYRNENRPDRQGVCYTVRKGYEKFRIPETEDPNAIQIDGLSHTEINQIFNNCSVFYSYDEATMYSQFAAIAGCLSVVIPGQYKTRQDWASAHELARYGVAYGLHEQEYIHAQETRGLLLEMLRHKEVESIETVRRFVTLTGERFL